MIDNMTYEILNMTSDNTTDDANEIYVDDNVTTNIDPLKIGILDPDGININPLNGEPYSEEYKKLGKIWSKFPAYEKVHEVLSAIDNNQIILITSATGSGKTVLLPKYVLHSFGYEKKVAVTLPKQMITESSAEFAAKTLDVKLGKEVGYKFKGSKKNSYSDKTKLLFATDGTIVAKLMNDPLLLEFNAVLIDEAHERKVQIDFLLYLLKQTCIARPDFKLVIMSATINEHVFIDYFREFKFVHFDVGGKTNYPIKSIFLDNPIDPKSFVSKGLEIINNIKLSNEKGDILFFVTSVLETIDSCGKLMSNSSTNQYCIEVFAGMNQKQQELAQEENISEKRKIIVATNVAESSLTISNIKYVIDSGYELFSYYDTEKKSKVLVKKLITQAQAKQRMGRAGRTGPGTCYHLYTKNDFENAMEKFPLPTIKVSNIYGECLKLLSLESIGTVENLQIVLSKFIEPPGEQYVKDSVTTLMRLGLIESGVVTKLGKIISDLQVDPMQGLSIYYGYQLGCAKEIIAIFSMIDAMKGNVSELFLVPKLSDPNIDSVNDIDNLQNSPQKHKHFDHMTKKFETAKDKLADSTGDHITLLKIFSEYKKLKKNKNDQKLNDWMYKHFLKKTVLEKANKHYLKIKNVSMSKLKNEISIDWKLHKQKTRILTAIFCGFFLNTLFLKDKKGQNIKISKDSFISQYSDSDNEIMYNELTTVNGNTSASIASKLSKSIRVFYSEIPQ